MCVARSTSAVTTSVRYHITQRGSSSHGCGADQSPEQVPFNDESDSEDEDGYDLRDVSSDVEMDPTEMMGIDDDESDDTDAQYEVLTISLGDISLTSA